MNADVSPQPDKVPPADELARRLTFSAVSQSVPSRERKEGEEQGKMDKAYTLSLLLASILRR
jgi:hypothetical protein